MPFYRGAKVREGATRRLTKKADGKQLSYYAVAILDTREAPEKVAQSYARQLPGKLKAERVVDKQGTRWVLAVSSKEEIRMVTITAARGGSTIKLTRAIKHTETLTLPETEAPPPAAEPPHSPRHAPLHPSPGGSVA